MTMPRTLITGLARSALHMKGRLLAAGLILGSALAMFVGMYSAIDSLFASRDQWYQEQAAADLEVRIVPTDATNIPAISQVPGVAAFEQRLTLPGNIDTPAGSKLYALMVAQEQAPTLNRLRIEAGKNLDPQHPYEVVIERSMALHHGLKIGDTFRFNLGQDHYMLTVRGIAMSPEFLIDSANPNFFLPSKGSLGVVYVPYSLIQPRLGYRLVNSLLVRIAPEAQSAEVEHRVQAALRPQVTLEESLPRARQFGHLYLNLDLGAFKIFVPAIVLIFVVTALIITLFVLMQWLHAKQREMGVMLALGYTPRQIALALTFPVGLIAAVALFSGLPMSLGILHGFGDSYARALGLPDPTLTWQPLPIILGVLGVFVVLAVALGAPLSRILRLTPYAALRGPARNANRAPAALKNGFERMSGSLSWRYAVRNLRRARGLSVMTGAAVALSLGAALSYTLSLTSFERSITERLEHDDWQLAVDFLVPVWHDELTPLARQPGVRRIDPFIRGPVTLQAGRAIEPSFLLGIEPSSPARSLRIVAGRGLREGESGALVVERKTAMALGLKIGDRFSIRARDTDWPVTLVGTFSGILPGESYATRTDAQRWFDMPEQVTGAFVKTDAGLSSPDALYKLKHVGRVTTKAALIDNFVHHLKEIAVIVHLSLGLSLIVAALFLWATTAFGVLRRQPEYTTLRTLGWHDRMVAGMVLIEVALVGIAGCVAAAAVGIALSSGLNALLSQAWFQIDTTITWADLSSVLIPAALLFPLTAWPPVRTILRANLALSLRQRSFG
jgi:putative ABC transport system permease protein